MAFYALTGKRCQNCLFFAHERCVRYPPIYPPADEVRNLTTNNYASYFPHIRWPDEIWCGEWKKRGNKNDN